MQRPDGTDHQRPPGVHDDVSPGGPSGSVDRRPSPLTDGGCSPGGVELRRATAADIPFVVATERLPGFDEFIGRWSEAEHHRLSTTPGTLYLIASWPTSPPEGFAIIRDLQDPDGNVFLKRVAVRQPGKGFGVPFMRAVVDWVFRETSAHRLWLDALEGNLRARHVYRKLGFVEEGAMRESFILPDGSRTSMIIMSLLRPEWLAAQQEPGRSTGS